MESLGGEKGAWSLEEQLQHIADQSFDGVNFEDDNPRCLEIVQTARDLGVRWSVTTFPKTVADLRTTIDLIDELGRDGFDHVNLQPNVRPGTVLEGIPFVSGWIEAAREAGIERLYIETHRDRMTTDLHYTLHLVDAIPSMRLTADLSHFVVAREFRWPISEEDEALIMRIIDRADAFHGRVATREQIQVQLAFRHQRHWVEVFMHWWEEGFRRWRKRSDPDATLNFLVELGPPPYAMTGADGEELSDRWDEALEMQRMIRTLWTRLDREDQASRTATN